MNGSDRECLTVLLGANANGDMPPPLIMYNYRRVPAALSNNNFLTGFATGISKSEWMTVDSFHEYITGDFTKWLEKEQIPRPIILFLDGHCSHMSLKLSEFCRDNSIVLIALKPNTTHITQPMDVGVFRSLKLSWKKQRGIWNQSNPGIVFNKSHFSICLKDALDDVKRNPNLFQNAFRGSGKPFE